MALVPIVRYFNWALSVTLVSSQIDFRDGRGLNMSFRVQRTLSSEPDTCELGIEGFEPTIARTLSRTFSELGTGRLVVRGGYDDTLGGLFAGDLRSLATPVQRGPALWTTVIADDGGERFTDAVVPINTTVGLTASNMIDIATTALGLVLGPSVAAVLATSNPTRTSTFTAAGVKRATDLLDQACRRIGARWWVRDDQVHLGRRGVVDPSRPAIVLDRSNVTSELVEDGAGVMRVSAFFDPNIVPGGQVFYQGTNFKVESVNHGGETRGRAIWSSDITARAL